MIMGVTASTSTGIMIDQFASIQNGKNYYVELDSNGILAANWGGGRKRQPEMLWQRETFVQEDRSLLSVFGL